MKLQSLQLLAIFFIPVAVCPGQIISTVVGTPTCCNSADGIQATSTWLASLDGFTLDRVGNLYFGQGARIRKVSPSGVVTTVAGNGNFGYTGDGGPATSAQLFPNTGLRGIVVDEGGNIYFSDGNNHVIRKVSASGIITTVAGNGAPGYSGDGGKATAAMLQYPTDIALDAAGNLYIADNSNSRVRKVTPAGIITTFAGNGNVAYSGDGVQATAASVHAPSGLAFDAAGNLYISEGSDSRVRRVDTSGIITTVAGLTKKTIGLSGDGGPATAATLAGPIGLSVDQSGNLYIADNSNGRIRKVDAAGTITTFAGITGNASSPIGDNGPATSAYLGVPTCVKVDAAGTVYLSGSAAGVGRIRKVTAAAGLSASPSSLSFAFSIGGATPAAQSLSITSSGGAAGFTAVATTTSGGNWLSVTPGSGTAPASLSVSVNPAGLPGGAYQGAITLTPSGGTASSFAVTLTVTGAGAPVFSGSAVFNALGYQNKLAPGTVFVIFGSAMGPANLVSVAGPDYPVSAGGTSVTFTPAAGGAAVSARMIYSSAGQLAGLLPSSITPGAYAVRITYNTLASAPQTVNVVARSFGIATSNSGGTGTAQATIGNVNGGVSLTRFTTGAVSFGGLDWTLTPAHPGDTLVLWGTGGGADPSNDNGGSSGDQTKAGNFTVTVAGRQITPIYAGASSGYAGLWQINFTLPSDISPECFASLQVTAGGELSNSVTLPIAPTGQDFCADPQLSKSALTLLDNGGTVTLGGFGIAKLTSTTSLIATPGAAVTTTTAAQESVSGGFPFFTAAGYAAIYAGLKIGPCTVTDRTASANTPSSAGPAGYLDAGATLPVAGPGLSAGAAMSVFSTNPGPVYDLLPANGTIVGGGKYTITGNGGKGVGSFSASVTFPSGFTVANWDTLNSIDRSKPLTLNWTGAGLDQVYIIGSSSQVVGKDASNINIIHTATFTCTVPAAPGSYTIPTAVLSYLLPGTFDAASLAKGSTILAVQTVTSQPFTPPVLSGASLAFAGISATLSYSRNLAVQ